MESGQKFESKITIRSFHDLEVYRNTYKDAIVVLKEIVSKLPKKEKYNLADQIRRACMAIPVLIAEGYAKKHLQRAFSKYLDDANGECNEMIVHLSFCLDIYGNSLDKDLLRELIANYDKYARQIYKLSNAWRNFKHQLKL